MHTKRLSNKKPLTAEEKAQIVAEGNTTCRKILAARYRVDVSRITQIISKHITEQIHEYRKSNAARLPQQRE